MTPRATFCVPIYRGDGFLPELCAALRAQTMRDFLCVLSVDGDDDTPSLAAAQRELSDSRFTLRVNRPRAGWSGHIDALLRASETDYALYMAQDDLPEPEYLAVLVSAVAAAAEPVSAFTDIRYFGAVQHVETNQGIGGARLERMRAQLARQAWIPCRGLVPRALARSGLFATTTPDQIAEDHVAVLRMAIFGPVLRIPAPLYGKRVHEANTGGRWIRWGPERRRTAWAELAVRLLECALPQARNEGERRLLWDALFLRHCLPRVGRQEFWIPGPEGVAGFAAEILNGLATRGHDVAGLLGALPVELAKATTARLAAFDRPVQ